MNNDKLFDYIKPLNNDQLSLMSGCDLRELIYYLDNYYLEMRTSLGFTPDITFGLELEVEEANRTKIEEKLKENSLARDWNCKLDESLVRGVEIASPILTDNRKSWKNLEEVCSITEKYSTIDIRCGGHIHVGVQTLGEKLESWINFMKLWSVYENIVYRFAYGQFLTHRPVIQRYAEPISKRIEEHITTLEKFDDIDVEAVVRIMSFRKYQAVNFCNVNYNDLSKNDKNTIEFRCPNGTLDPVIWQNNINLFVNMLLYSKSLEYNNDIVLKREKTKSKQYQELSLYNEIYLNQALELCDMLFNNNLDKIFFLRQYLKYFETSDKKLAKAKTFTKIKNI